jgi:hypothetical protein
VMTADRSCNVSHGRESHGYGRKHRSLGPVHSSD